MLAGLGLDCCCFQMVVWFGDCLVLYFVEHINAYDLWIWSQLSCRKTMKVSLFQTQGSYACWCHQQNICQTTISRTIISKMIQNNQTPAPSTNTSSQTLNFENLEPICQIKKPSALLVNILRRSVDRNWLGEIKTNQSFNHLNCSLGFSTWLHRLVWIENRHLIWMLSVTYWNSSNLMFSLTVSNVRQVPRNFSSVEFVSKSNSSNKHLNLTVSKCLLFPNHLQGRFGLTISKFENKICIFLTCFLLQHHIFVCICCLKEKGIKARFDVSCMLTFVHFENLVCCFLFRSFVVASSLLLPSLAMVFDARRVSCRLARVKRMSVSTSGWETCGEELAD